MDVNPQNLSERAYAVFAVVNGLVGFSYIVGSITGSLAQLRSMYAEESKQFWDLRRYLKKNDVTPDLSLRIQKYLEHAWRRFQENKPVKDVKVMQMLSDQLTSELKYELSVPQLQIHPFLKELCAFSRLTSFRLAKSCVEHKLLAQGDYLFHPNEEALHMYIVVKGRCMYRRVDSNGKDRTEQVDKGEDWIAEPVLWSQVWEHRGLLEAVDEGDHLAIDAHSFSQQVRRNPDAHIFASGYAKNFIEWLNGCQPDDLSDITQGKDMSKLLVSFIDPKMREDSLGPTALARSNSARRLLGASRSYLNLIVD